MRERALKRFSDGKLAVLVATDVAARGLDIDELDIVIQADPPPDPKTYLHRSGRTARAGAAGLAVTLVLWNEELEMRRLKRRLALGEPIVEMFSNDERLADLAGWDPAEEARPSHGPRTVAGPGVAAAGGRDQVAASDGRDGQGPQQAT